jgi:hypothetical protein
LLPLYLPLLFLFYFLLSFSGFRLISTTLNLRRRLDGQDEDGQAATSRGFTSTLSQNHLCRQEGKVILTFGILAPPSLLRGSGAADGSDPIPESVGPAC